MRAIIRQWIDKIFFRDISTNLEENNINTNFKDWWENPFPKVKDQIEDVVDAKDNFFKFLEKLKKDSRIALKSLFAISIGIAGIKLVLSLRRRN